MSSISNNNCENIKCLSKWHFKTYYINKNCLNVIILNNITVFSKYQKYSKNSLKQSYLLMLSSVAVFSIFCFAFHRLSFSISNSTILSYLFYSIFDQSKCSLGEYSSETWTNLICLLCVLFLLVLYIAQFLIVRSSAANALAIQMCGFHHFGEAH